jgi:hypothetical protein
VHKYCLIALTVNAGTLLGAYVVLEAVFGNLDCIRSGWRG